MRTIYFATAAVALLSVACNRDTHRAGTTTDRTTTGAETARERRSEFAFVRFINADATRKDLDLWFGDMKVFTGTPYKKVTEYTQVPAERHEFHLRMPGAVDNLANNSEGLGERKHYTLIAVHKDDGSSTLTAVNDDEDPPAAGKAKVRVINAVTNLDDLDLVARGHKDKIIDGVDFNSASRYKEVEPLAVPLEIRREDTKAVAARLPGFTMEPNKAYTVVVFGNKGQPLDAVHVEDRVTHENARR